MLAGSVMNNYREIFWSLFKRSLLGIPLVVFGYLVLCSPAGGALQSYAGGAFGCVFIICGAIVLAFPLARLLAEPWGNWFWPGDRYDRPQPMYGIPQSRRAKGLYKEALAGYEEILKEHPGERRAYVEMIEIAVVNLNDANRANVIFRRGMDALEKEDDKAALAQMYSAIRSRLKPIDVSQGSVDAGQDDPPG